MLTRAQTEFIWRPVVYKHLQLTYSLHAWTIMTSLKSEQIGAPT